MVFSNRKVPLLADKHLRNLNLKKNLKFKNFLNNKLATQMILTINKYPFQF